MTAPGERTDVTAEQIAEWVALADAATPGEWAYCGFDDRCDVFARPDGPLVATTPPESPDAVFITVGRAAVPALAAALESARADNDRLRAELEMVGQTTLGTALVLASEALAELDDAQSERDAARAELVAERAKVQAVEAALARDYPPSPFADNVLRAVRRALATQADKGGPDV